jgi:flagellar hook protein FlgE
MGFKTATGALLANKNVLQVVTQDIANSNTIGYKEGAGFFIAVVAGSGSDFPGGGVLAKNTQNVAAQGNLQTSNTATHLAISGNGFFVCSRSDKVMEIEYTRAGHWLPDNKGNLTNLAGLYLLGWATDEQGNVPISINKSDISSLQQINVNKISGLSKPTTKMEMGFNLPSDIESAPIAYEDGTTTSIYDSLGAKHNLRLNWKKTAIDTWSLLVACPNEPGVTLQKDGTTDAYLIAVKFDGDGKPLSFDGNPEPPKLSITWDPLRTNANKSVIDLDLGTVGEGDGVTCGAGAFRATKEIQDGREFGTFRNVTISDDGKIYAVYSNGQSLIIGRIALANFAAPDQLESQSGSSYIETDSSGTYSLSEAKLGGFGKIVANALEASTVDLAAKLTELIELQNHYTANTKSISVEKGQDSEIFKMI